VEKRPKNGSGVFNLNEVLYNPDHTHNLGIALVFNCLIDFAETQSLQGVFLALGFVNRTFDQGNFYFAHVRCSLCVGRCWLFVVQRAGNEQPAANNKIIR